MHDFEWIHLAYDKVAKATGVSVVDIRSCCRDEYVSAVIDALAQQCVELEETLSERSMSEEAFLQFLEDKIAHQRFRYLIKAQQEEQDDTQEQTTNAPNGVA